MGVEAAQRDLEDIAPPLSAQGEELEELEEPGEQADPYTLAPEQGRRAPLAARASNARGPMERGAIGEALGRKYWGPFRFRQPLRGAFRKVAGGRYAPV